MSVNVYGLLFEQAIAAHNPFLCALCSTGAQARCPIDRELRKRDALAETALAHAAEGGGHYLMCPCDYCKGQVLAGQMAHEQRCKRPNGEITCAHHGLVMCHCDCR